MAEYRIEELAAATGTTVRTLQAYRNKGLLQAPRRQGRIALYNDDHVRRLELIADLLSRGYSLNAVGELLTGLDRGDRIEDLLGLKATIDGATDEPESFVTRRDLVAMFGDRSTGIDELVSLGILVPVDDARPDGSGAEEDSRYRVALPRMLSAGAALDQAGIPIEVIIDEGHRLQGDIDGIAARFVHLALDHVIEGGAVRSESHAASITELVNGLVPFASVVVDEYLRVAMHRHIAAAIQAQLDGLLDETSAEARFDLEN